jgi:CBS domain-containing protein
MKVRDIMTTQIVTVTEEAAVSEIAALMLDKGISGVPVVDGRGDLVGMISEGDLIHRAEIGTEEPRSWWLNLFTGQEDRARDYVKSHGAHARDVMTRPARYVDADVPIAEVARRLERERVKRLPVLDDGKLAGIVSRADLLRALAARPALSPEAPAATDRNIRDSLMRTLDHEDWAASAMVNVIVSDGVVNLWGVVDTEDQRRAIKVAAENTPGVKGVEDHMGREIPI